MNERASPRVHTAGEPDSPGTMHMKRARHFRQSRKPSLSPEQQQALIKLVKDGDHNAKRKMIEHNMHLVVDFAKHYANRGPAPLDLIMTGNQGLIEALDEYRPEGGFSFQAHAIWCICENIEHTILNWGKPSHWHASRPPDRHPAPSPARML